MGILAGAFEWYAWASGLLLIAGGVAYFFRDPERIPPADPSAVVSPADGRIVEVVDEPYAGQPGHRVSIFLAIWNVHVNRAPVAGRIERVQYQPGRFCIASRARASAENEQNIIHLQTERGPMVFKQIAGWVARRVVCWKAAGDVVARGERIGLIRFGSRMDVWLPAAAKVRVERGEHVAGGKTVLANWS
jgi:phosphatidylserine decarboxylase